MVSLSILKKKEISLGHICSIKDNICLASGLKDCFVGETVLIYTKKFKKLEGFVINLEERYVKIVLIRGSQNWIQCGDSVYRTRSLVKTRAGFFVLGRILNPVGDLLNSNDHSEKKKIFSNLLETDYVLVDIVAPGIIKRISVKKPFLTGVTSVDCFIPIGCGQRELIIGDHNTGKTSLAITALLNQKYINGLKKWRSLENSIKTDDKIFFTPCIFVGIGKKRSEIARLKELLVLNNCFSFTSFMYASSDDKASLQYLAPYVGCALGEWFMNRGYDSLVVYDDLSEHAVAYRQMSLLLRRPPGREAYPGDVFYLHSRLLERAAQLSLVLGGGSLTALPIVETKGGDISSYIPTNVISITDGQLFLNSDLVNRGIRPAIDLKLSVSRVGSAAQCQMMTTISKKMKYLLAMFHSLDGVEKLGTVSGYVLTFLKKGRQMYKFFTQPVYETISLYRQVICLYCIGEGYSDEVNLDYLDLFFRILFDEYFLSFYLNKKELSIFLNRKTINSIFLSYNFDFIKSDLDNICNKYSSFFISYIQKRLDTDTDSYYYKELLQLLSNNKLDY